MARKHDQRPDNRLFVCTNCKNNKCGSCVDVLRMVYTTETICKCTRQNHMGEAAEEQVADPFTGSVFGPHSVITEDGKVTTDEEFKQQWRREFGDYE